MDIFLELSMVQGLVMIVAGTALVGITVVVVVRRLIVNHLEKQHERIGRLLFRVTASLLALLISLSYANEKMAYNKVVNSLEQEAAIISSVFLKLRMFRSEGAEAIRDALEEYVRYTIDDKWRNTVNNPYSSKMAGTLVNINVVARHLKVESPVQESLKQEIITDIDSITKTMQIRFYSIHFSLPYLTYILAFGLLIIWCFYAVYRNNALSLVFITLYNVFIAMVFYFVVMLGNPLAGPLKIKPEPFIILLEKGLTNLPF